MSQTKPINHRQSLQRVKNLIWLNFHSFYFQLFFPLFFGLVQLYFRCYAAVCLCRPFPALSNSLQHDVARPTPSISHSSIRRYRRCSKSQQHTTGSPGQAVNSSSRTKDERLLTLMETTCDIISLKVEQTRACKSNEICLNFNFISHWIR